MLDKGLKRKHLAILKELLDQEINTRRMYDFLLHNVNDEKVFREISKLRDDEERHAHLVERAIAVLEGTVVPGT